MKAFKIVLGAAIAAMFLGAPATANEDLPIAVAESKNLVERTVTLDDQTFRVTDSTEILDRVGNPMPLEAVETAADHGPAVELDRVMYAYDAHGDALALLKSVPLPR